MPPNVCVRVYMCVLTLDGHKEKEFFYFCSAQVGFLHWLQFSLISLRRTLQHLLPYWLHVNAKKWGDPTKALFIIYDGANDTAPRQGRSPWSTGIHLE